MDKKIIWKFNLIDLVIIALIALSLIALAYRVFTGSNTNMQNFEIVCVCDDAPLELLYGVSTGSACIDGTSGIDLGKIVKSEVEPLSENSDRGKGKFSLVVDGIKNEHGISISDAVYLKGSVFSLIIEDSVFDVYIYDIR